MRVKFKPVSKLDIHQFGLLEGNACSVDTVEELKKNPPNIVIAQCQKTFSFYQNAFKLQTLTKKVNYVMSLGIYSQLQYVKEGSKKIKVLKPGKFQFKNLYKPYLGQNLDNKKLLIWRTGGIGDLIFIKPILQFLKEKYPNSKIFFSCAPQYQSMVENYPEIDKLVDLPFNASVLFDTDYHALFEGVIERTEEAKKVNAYELFAKSLGLDIPREKLVPVQNAKQEKITECLKILDNWKIKANNFIMLQMRASSPIRSPRPDFWLKIINELSKKYNIVITDSPHQSENLDKFISKLDNKDKIFNFAKLSKSIDMTIAMASLCKMVVATDSALVHIGASLSKKVFGIYGPFPGKIRMGTYSNCDWIEPKNIKCCPCFIHGHLPCENSKRGFSTCYDAIKYEDAVEKIESLMKTND